MSRISLRRRRLREGERMNAIEIEDVSVGYEREEILHGVRLEVPAGRITTLIGSNGSGKSTLLRAVLGLVPLRGGDVRLEGVSIKGLSRAELARRAAYLPQGKNVPDITAGRMVLHGRFPYLEYPRRYGREDYAAAGAAMEQMGIGELAGRPMSQLSGGMRQKVYIAMALAQQAPLIVMDEPTTYLDIGQQLRFAETVRRLSREGKTVLLVLHDILLALKLSDRIAVLQEGIIAGCGAPEELLKAGVTQRLYGVRVGTVETDRGRQYYYDI